MPENNFRNTSEQRQNPNSSNSTPPPPGPPPRSLLENEVRNAPKGNTNNKGGN